MVYFLAIVSIFFLNELLIFKAVIKVVVFRGLFDKRELVILKH